MVKDSPTSKDGKIDSTSLRKKVRRIHRVYWQRNGKILEHCQRCKWDQSARYICVPHTHSRGPLHLITLILTSFSTKRLSSLLFRTLLFKDSEASFTMLILSGLETTVMGTLFSQAIQPQHLNHLWPILLPFSPRLLPSPVDITSAILLCPQSTSPAEDSCHRHPSSGSHYFPTIYWLWHLGQLPLGYYVPISSSVKWEQ